MQHMKSTAHETVVVKTLTTATSGVLEVGSILLPNGGLSHPTVLVLPDVDPANLTGAQVVDHFIYVPDTTLSNPLIITLPSAAEIVAAFTTARKPLAVGDCFNLYIAHGATGTYSVSITLTGATGVSFAAGASTRTVSNNKTAQLTMQVTALGLVPTIVIHPIVG